MDKPKSMPAHCNPLVIMISSFPHCNLQWGIPHICQEFLFQLPSFLHVQHGLLHTRSCYKVFHLHIAPFHPVIRWVITSSTLPSARPWPHHLNRRRDRDFYGYSARPDHSCSKVSQPLAHAPGDGSASACFSCCSIRATSLASPSLSSAASLAGVSAPFTPWGRSLWAICQHQEPYLRLQEELPGLVSLTFSNELQHCLNFHVISIMFQWFCESYKTICA